MAKKGSNTGEDLRSIYEQCLEKIPPTTEFLNGLMVVARPVVMSLVERPDIGESRISAGFGRVHEATRPTELSNPKLRVWRVAIRDAHNNDIPPGHHSDATILDSTIEVWSGQPFDEGEKGIGDVQSQLARGYSQTDLLKRFNTYTAGGAGAFRPWVENDLSPYSDPDELGKDYAHAFVTRAASGLLTARMIQGFSAAQQGQALDMPRIETEAIKVFAAWSAIDPAATEQTLEPLRRLSPVSEI